jgi:hypothetical protein
MKALLKFRPDLHASELEERLVPAGPDLGVMVLTASGYVLMTPFAGAAYPGGPSGGTPIPTSFVMTGSGGIFSMQPGSIAGVTGATPTGTTGSNGGASVTIAVGSGANDPSALNIQAVTRNTIANDALVPPPRIGSVFGDRSAPLPLDQVYRGGLPVTVPAGGSTEVPGERAGQISGRRPVDAPSPRPGSAPYRLPSDASANPVATITDRVP